MDQQDKTKPGDTPALTMEAVQGEINRAVATAVSSLRAEVEKAVKASADQVAAVAKTIEALKAPADPDKAKPPIDPQVNAQLQALTNQNKQLADQVAAMKKESDEARASAERADRESKIRTKLAGFTFANDASRDAAFRIFNTEVRRAEDGSLIAGDQNSPLPFDKYIEEQMAKSYEGLLAPRDKGGSGASPGSGRTGAKVTLDKIRPGMTPEDRAAAFAEVRNLYRAQ